MSLAWLELLLGSKMWAFGLGIFDVFCHYMLSSGALVGRFCPMVQLALATHMAAVFPGSDLGASKLEVSSHVLGVYFSRKYF